VDRVRSLRATTKSPDCRMIGANQKESKGSIVRPDGRGHSFQRMKATNAAKIRPVLPAAVMRSAPLDAEEEFVLESVEFESLELSVVCAGEFDIVLCKMGKLISAGVIGTKRRGRRKKAYKVDLTVLVGDAVVLDCVMENWPV